MSALYAIIDWDDGLSNDIPLTAVKQPRKDLLQYKVGERVEAKLFGFPGFHWGNIAAIDADRKWLKEQLVGTRPIIPQKKNKEEKEEKVHVKSKRKLNTKDDLEETSHSDTDHDVSYMYKEDESEMEETPAKKKVQTCKKRRLDLQDAGSVKKSEKSNDKEEKHISDESKKLKKEISKKKTEMIREREKVFRTKASEILPEQQTLILGTEKEKDERFDMLSANVKKVEEKMDEVLGILNHLFDCRFCMKKGYKKISATSETKMEFAKSPAVLKLSSSDLSPTLKTTCDIPRIASPIQSTSTIPTTPRSTSMTKSDTQNLNSVNVDNDSQNTKDEDEETTFEDDLAFLGDARYGVRIPQSIITRCLKVSKTPEKLALNLVPVLLTKEEIDTITVYGNKQFKREPMDFKKREALKSCIFNTFHDHAKKEDMWDRIVIAINDKIRGLRKGKYKHISH